MVGLGTIGNTLTLIAGLSGNPSGIHEIAEVSSDIKDRVQDLYQCVKHTGERNHTGEEPKLKVGDYLITVDEKRPTLKIKKGHLEIADGAVITDPSKKDYEEDDRFIDGVNNGASWSPQAKSESPDIQRIVNSSIAELDGNIQRGYEEWLKEIGNPCQGKVTS